VALAELQRGGQELIQPTILVSKASNAKPRNILAVIKSKDLRLDSDDSITIFFFTVSF